MHACEVEQMIFPYIKRFKNSVQAPAVMASYTFAHNMKEAAQGAIQANKDHQYSLKVYTERLEAELETVAKLLVSLIQLATRLHIHVSHRQLQTYPNTKTN